METGFPLHLATMLIAALLYLVTAVVFLASFVRERSEITVAFLAFLISMAVSLALMGVGQYANEPVLIYLGVFAVFTGSCFMLKLPLSALPAPWRTPAFYGCLLLSWSLLTWMIATAAGRQLLPHLSLWYMIIVNGAVTGLYAIWIGLRSKIPWVKVKATGGGLGIASCCMASHLTSLAGASLVVSASLQFASPLLILAAIFSGRRLQRQAELNQAASQNDGGQPEGSPALPR